MKLETDNAHTHRVHSIKYSMHAAWSSTVWVVSHATHPPKGEGLVKRYWTRCVACQEHGQTNQIAVCVHVAKAYALRGIEAAEDSSATNLGCSNLREKQKEAIVSFVTC